MAKKPAVNDGAAANGAAAGAAGSAVIDEVAKSVVASTRTRRGQALHEAPDEVIDIKALNANTFEGDEDEAPAKGKKGGKAKGKTVEKNDTEEGEAAAEEFDELEALAREATGEDAEAAIEPEPAEGDEEAVEGEEPPEGEEPAARPKPEIKPPEVLEAEKKVKNWKWALDEKGEVSLPKLVTHLEKTVEPAYVWAVNVDKMMGENEDFRAAYWTALEAKGQLTDEDAKKALAAYRDKQAKNKPAKQMTEQEFQAERRRLINMGKEDEAIDLSTEYRLGPKLAAIEKMNRDAEDKRQREIADQQERLTKAQRDAAAKKEVETLAAKMPSMMGVDAQGNGFFKHEGFKAKMTAIFGDEPPSVEELAYVALRRLKLTKPKPAKAKVASRPSRQAPASLRNGGGKRGDLHMAAMESYMDEANQ